MTAALVGADQTDIRRTPRERRSAEAMIRRPANAGEHMGRSHHASSLLGQLICREAGRTGQWRHVASHLDQLARNLRGS